MAENTEMKMMVSGIVDQMGDHFEIEDPVYGKRFFVRNGTTYQEVTKPTPTPIYIHKNREHKLADTQSMVSFINRYMDATSGIILFDDSSIKAYFDANNRVEFVQYSFVPSLELKAFCGDGPGAVFSQKNLVKAIETFPDVIAEGRTLLPYIELLQVQTIKDFESNVDPLNHTFIYQERRGGNQTATLPKRITFRGPYFEGSKLTTEFLLDMEIEIPKSENEKATFKLINPTHIRTRRDALIREIEEFRKGIADNWMVIQVH